LAAAALGAVTLAGGAFVVSFFLGLRDRGFDDRRRVFSSLFLRWCSFDSVAIRPEWRSFSITILADGEQRGGGIGHDHADELVPGNEADALHARGVPSHRPGIG